MRPRQFWMVELKWLNHENTKQHNNLGVSEKNVWKCDFYTALKIQEENVRRKRSLTYLILHLPSLYSKLVLMFFTFCYSFLSDVWFFSWLLFYKILPLSPEIQWQFSLSSYNSYRGWQKHCYTTIFWSSGLK